ncbi:MAG TPA: glycosyltransferase family 9 protein [Thermodesulfovibrionales bacterium]|nr:glycosyltransferase family 9 protein [Thermodesulfovibrionales bacterium]
MIAFKKILIIKPSSLGDIVHSLPVLAAVRRSSPAAEIHWVVARGFEGILEGHPFIKKLWILDKDAWKKISKVKSSVRELRSLFDGLRAERFDAAVDLQGLFRSGFIARASNAPVRLGFSDAREGSTIFYTDAVEGGLYSDIHAVDRYLKIAAYLGCDISRVRFPFPKPLKSLEEILPSSEQASRDYVVMAPGARGATKRWPAKRFGELASQLPFKTVVIGGKSDLHLAAELVSESRGKAISITGKTDMRDLVVVIRSARLMVCNDTGPMHIAAALGVRVFALFGSTNPLRTGPYGSNHTIIQSDLPCSPCYRMSCKTVECMTMIQVEEVLRRIDEFLRGR